MGKRIAGDFEKLRADIESGRTNSSIAAELDCAEDTVCRVAKAHGIKRPKYRPAKLNDAEWLRTNYIDDGPT